jgi:hypothetical protein
MVMWARDNFATPGLLDIVAIPEAKIDPQLPVRYKTAPSAVLLQNIVDRKDQPHRAHDRPDRPHHARIQPLLAQ